MVEQKWTQFGQVDSARQYLAFAENGERKSVLAFFKFMNRARKMQKQMASAKGFIGFRGKLGFLGKDVLMVAVFEDEATLNEFAHTGQHAACLAETKSDLKDGMKYAKWTITGSNVPPTLDDALNRIKNEK